MADNVNPSGGQPLYYSKEFAFTKMSVDHVFSYTVLHLYHAGALMRILDFFFGVLKSAYYLSVVGGIAFAAQAIPPIHVHISP